MSTPVWQLELTEAEFQSQVCQLAELYGWSWAHFRPAMTKYGWRTPVSGPLGAGWPDLVMVRGDRLVFVELKRDRTKPTGLQDTVLTILSQTRAEVYVWRPRDWDLVMEVLTGASQSL